MTKDMAKYKLYYEFMVGSLQDIPLDIEGLSAEEFLKKQGQFEALNNLVQNKTEYQGSVKVITPPGGNIVVNPLNKEGFSSYSNQ